MINLAIGLSSELLTAVFPFYLALNYDCQLVQCGDCLHQLCPGLEIDSLFEQHFRVICPAIPLNFELIRQQPHSLFLIEVLLTGMQLKGHMLYIPEQEIILFLGSPRIKNMGDLKSLSLKATKINTHSQSSPAHSLLQVQKDTLANICNLAQKLICQQSEIDGSAEEEQALKQMKSRFVTKTAHEFRTPLGIISSSAGILQDYEQELSYERRQKHLFRIQAAVQHITRLLEDAL